MYDFHVRIAFLHREIERRHLVAADIHATYADRLDDWAIEASGPSTAPPRFISAVASTLGSASTGITLFGAGDTGLFAAASDAKAAAAQQAEVGFGEGPIHDASRTLEPIIATLDTDRWPHYAPMVSRLGLGSVAAAPLCSEAACVGVLSVFDPSPPGGSGVLARLRSAADALTDSLLLDPTGDPPLFEDPDQLAVLHQAAGMLSERSGCGITDALALIRARAFAESTSVETIAERIVHRRLRLDAPAAGDVNDADGAP